MAVDRVSELYNGELGAAITPEPLQACRERAHWMCARTKGERVLDLGCSQGVVSILLGREGHFVEGVDVDEAAIEYARAALESEPEYVRAKVAFTTIDPDALPFEDGVFDTVVIGDVLEYQTRADRLLAEVWRTLRPDGRAVVSAPFGLHPNRRGAHAFYLSEFLTTVGAFFECDEIEVLNRHICFAGRRRAATLTPEEVELDAQSALAASEETMRRVEQHHLDQNEALLKKLSEVSGDASTYRARLEIADDERLHKSRALKKWKKAALESLSRLAAITAEEGFGDSVLADRLERMAALLRDNESSEEAAALLPEILGLLQKNQTRCAKSLREECLRRQTELETLRQQLAGDKQALDEARQNVLHLNARISRQLEQIEYFKTEAGLKYEEVRYRLGDAMVRASSSPTDFVLLPARMVKLMMDGRRRRRERKQASGSPRDGGVKTAATLVAKTAPNTLAIAPAAPKIRFNPVEIPDRAPRLPIKMAAIMDEFTLACFRPECRVIPVTPDDWKEKLTQEKPDLLFVESAWNGVGGAWRFHVARPRPVTEGPLLELVNWCKSQKIPTVFWNKEDPPNFEHFIHAAALFEHVFTTDANCIPIYRARLKHDRVYALPFAAQGAVHNPLGSRKNLVGDVCFAGSYYAERHKERQQDLEMLLAPALKRGLHIYDRMHGTDDARYMFPEKYRDAIQGGLSYPEMLDAYKRYKLFLNVNSVIDSPTMFSRRVLELLACGTPVISTYALGVEKLLGRECVPLVSTEEESTQWLDMLLKNAELVDRMVLKGQRRIFNEHTYEHRLRDVLTKVGVECSPPKRRVSIITCTNRPAKLEQIIANYERQNYADKEFLLVLNSDDYSLDAVKKRLAPVPNARAFQLPEECTLGECLNKAISEMRHEYWSKFDDDNFYAANFIGDLMLPFSYTEASVIGKYTYYAYMEGANCLALRYPGCEHQYVSLLSGSALIVDRRVMDEVQFPEKNRGEDTQFLRECVARGFKLYSADRFNYVVRRSAKVEDHTWQITQDEFMRHCEVVAYIDDFRSHVSV